ncbi:hypothetical protein J4462_03790 [Candidatus Pacearchaeota archaeon]|nr:hypothetical protein [Candidatus Pacearchaeota archaeon]
MVEVIDLISSFLGKSLTSNVLLFSVILAVISLFIWNFYKSISKRNLIKLNLSKYNTSEHPFWSKLQAIFLYLLEYIVIMPLLIILWYAALSLVLLLIASEVSVSGVLFVSSVLVGSIRILAYFNSEISKDVAKLFPLIALSVFLLSFETINKTFNFGDFTNKIYQIPTYYGEIFSFILIVFVIEIVLRVIFTIYEFWRSEEEAAGEVVSSGGDEDEDEEEE